MTHSKQISQAILNEVNNTKQYSLSGGWDTEITKVWNRGMGLLTLLKIYENEKIVLINYSLWNRYDQKHWENIVNNATELKEYKVIRVYYGYPTYYNHSLCLSLYKKRTDLIHKDDRETFMQMFND